MHALMERLLAESPVVTDGAWGTSLQAAGLETGACPDAWNLLQPDRVEAVARSYVAAGSRIILSNTFGSSRIALTRYGLQDQTVDINTAGARLSKQAAGQQSLVFCSIGSTGKMVLMGEVPETDVAAAFTEQAQALKEGGADGLAIETMSDLVEARLAIVAAQATGLPVVACMSFDSGPNQLHTMMGVSVEQAAREFTALGVDAVGANCGQGIAGMLAVCQELRRHTPLPIWIKGNAGTPRLEDGRAVYDMQPEDFAAHVPELMGAGAQFIGGCCGTGPDFVSALVQRCAQQT